MQANDILTKQISDQIEGKITVEVFCSDLDEGATPCDTIYLYDQPTGKYIEFWGRSKRLTDVLWNELISLISEEGEFNTDPLTIRWQGSYDEFYDKFWNNL